MNHKLALLLGVLIATATPLVSSRQQAPGSSSDWTQWRGANRDAAVSGSSDPRQWPAQLAEGWKVEVGLGYATPLVVGNRLYVFARQGNDEVMSALDVANGAVSWKATYAAPFTMHPAAVRHGAGPKSTPVFASGRLFSIGMSGIVTAFDASNGTIVWQKPAGTANPMYNSHAFSPIVDQGAVIFHIGGHDQGALTAFSIADGTVRWTWIGDGPAYGSPIVATLQGVRQLITLTQNKLVGLDVANGSLLWERAFPSARFVNAATPVLVGDTVMVSNGGPATAVRVMRRDGQWTTDVVWENADTPYTFSNALIHDGMLLGLSSRNSGQYFGVDPASGKTLWLSEPRQATNAAILRVGEVLLSLEDDGELIVATATRSSFSVIRRHRVSEGATWTVPVLSAGRLFVKDESSLTSWGLN